MNAEEEAMGEERREEDGVGEEEGGALMVETLPEERVGDKQERAVETVFGEVKPSTDTGVGEDAGTTLNGEEQGGTRTEEEEGGRGEEVGRALTGDGEWCVRLGLKAEGMSSVSWLWVAVAGLRRLRDPESCWSCSLDLEIDREAQMKINQNDSLFD